MRTGTVVERSADSDRAWTTHLAQFEDASAARLPEGATSGVRVALPFIEIPRYLPWLKARVHSLGVTFEHRTVASIEELAADSDLVVIAAGLRGGDLLGGNESVYPVRGQIVRLANPGLEEWMTDEGNPDGLTYIFPREHDVVVGGTADEGSWDTEIDRATEAAILERAVKLVPELANQPVIGRACGLRPARPSIRLERVTIDGVPVITAYGHGGAGVTLSWGTADRVAALADG